MAILTGVDAELVYCSAVEFLGQFIARGAAEDLHQLRARLVNDERTKKLLLEQLPARDIDERDAFDAFRRFLSVELEQREHQNWAGSPDLVLLLSWTDWGADGLTSDPAQWHDWLAAVATATGAV
jgi:hypothetical protein